MNFTNSATKHLTIIIKLFFKTRALKSETNVNKHSMKKKCTNCVFYVYWQVYVCVQVTVRVVIVVSSRVVTVARVTRQMTRVCVMTARDTMLTAIGETSVKTKDVPVSGRHVVLTDNVYRVGIHCLVYGPYSECTQ